MPHPARPHATADRAWLPTWKNPRKRASRVPQTRDLRGQIWPGLGHNRGIPFPNYYQIHRHGAQFPCRKTETKKPSVSVVRGDMSSPFGDRRADLAKTNARSPRDATMSAAGCTENSGCRARKAWIWSAFSSSNTEQVM